MEEMELKKKMGKIFKSALLVLMLSFVFNTTVFATSSDSLTVALYMKESNELWSAGDVDPKEWSEPTSEPVTITEDGTYTLSLFDLDIPEENFCLCYIKDTLAYAGETPYVLPEDLMIITDVIKVNGVEKSVYDNVRTGLKDGVFDICYHNDWDENDCTVDFLGVINSVEVTFTVTGLTGEPGAITYAAEAEAPVVEETTTDAVTTDSADAALTVTTENTTDSSDNASFKYIASAVGILLIAGVAIVFLTRKGKKS
jgi:hypothetical protein